MVSMGDGNFFLMEGRYFFNKEVNTIWPLSAETMGPSIKQKKNGFFHMLNVCTIYF